MTEPRKPGSFRLPQAEAARPETPEVRRPRALRDRDLATVTPAPVDIFDMDDVDALEPPPIPVIRRRSRLGSIFLGALGLLVSLAVGLWTEQLIRELFSRADWLGWLAAVLAAIALAALLVMLVRELVALARLASVEKLRARGAQALLRNEPKLGRAVVEDLLAFLASKPETAAGRRALAAHRDEVIDGADLVRLAETELLAPLDARARILILDAAKRVSIVTAVSPRALVDVVYVLFEAGRLIRRLAELYGGRPGTLGFFRLARNVLAHLAVTGSIAVGDSLVQQVIGHGLAARLSARLGEGVVNGAMTVRIGIAAMETARPLPFSALKRPGLGDFLSALVRFSASREQAETKRSD
jgi:putative membrane protein